MAVVMMRGAIQGEPVDQVAGEAMFVLPIFLAIGAVAGWIMDQLVCESVEIGFRKRVDWYRQGLVDTGYLDTTTNEAH
jgi:hypothetical protein